MKKIYVTVQEFLDNGGTLGFGRMLYTFNGSPYGNFVEFDFNGECVYTDADKEFPLLNTDVYVKINCQPIYN